MQWAWDTITGQSESHRHQSRFIPRTQSERSRWGGMDFDAHDGDYMRARDLAFKAFADSVSAATTVRGLTTSAGDPEHSGFHLFVFSRDFYPREDWTRLFKQVAAQIGAPIEDGVCEIFPNESRGFPSRYEHPEAGTRRPATVV